MAYDPLSNTSILPYGPQLNSLLWSSSLTEADLRRFLRRKGIFVCFDDKKDLIPLLTTTLLSPREFEFLKDMHTLKEEIPKRHSTILRVKNLVNFGNILDPNFDITSLVNEEFCSYSFVGAPLFEIKGKAGDRLELNFEVEHYDPSRNWFEAKTVSKGTVSFDKKADGTYSVSSTQTSKEAKALNKSVINYVKMQMKLAGVIDNGSEIVTAFNIFSHEKRIAFLLDILFKGSALLQFLKITDIDVKPIDGVTLPDTPEVKWMQDRIKQLKLHGDGLENTFFVDSTKYHSCLLFPRIEADCNFSTDEADGVCSITLHFSDYPRKIDSNLEILVAIKKFLPKKETAKPQRVRDILLNDVDNTKTDIFLQEYQDASHKFAVAS